MFQSTGKYFNCFINVLNYLLQYCHEPKLNLEFRVSEKKMMDILFRTFKILQSMVSHFYSNEIIYVIYS